MMKNVISQFFLFRSLLCFCIRKETSVFKIRSPQNCVLLASDLNTIHYLLIQ